VGEIERKEEGGRERGGKRRGRSNREILGEVARWKRKRGKDTVNWMAQNGQNLLN